MPRRNPQVRGPQSAPAPSYQTRWFKPKLKGVTDTAASGRVWRSRSMCIRRVLAYYFESPGAVIIEDVANRPTKMTSVIPFHIKSYQ